VAVEIIQSIGPKELGPQKQIESEKAQPKGNRQKADVRPSRDDVQISNRAKALNEEFGVLKARAEAASDDQSLRIAAAKQRVASGFYLQEDVLEQVADKILEREPIRPEADTERTRQSDKSAPIDARGASSDKISQAKARAAEGFYQQNDVLKVTAEKIIKDLIG
jgi:hypothetical protein